MSKPQFEANEKVKGNFLMTIRSDLRRISDGNLLGAFFLNYFFRNPVSRAILVYGIGNSFYKRKLYVPGIAFFLEKVLFVPASIVIPPQAEIGEGFILQHGFGTIIASGVVIGKNCWLPHQVTIGHRDKRKPPQLGDNVFV